MSDTQLHADVTLESVETLIPYSNNPKEHPDEQVKKIASSIKNYGWDQPIVVDGEGEIIKGHGRLQAAELLGLDEVPVIRREDLTDAEVKAARIADNKTAESEWLDDELTTELELLGDFDDVELGFDEGGVDELLAGMETPEFEPVSGDSQPGLDEKSETDAWDENDDMVCCPECDHRFVPTDEDMG